MRKFAANYLISESGVLLKNGIVVATDDGTAIRMMDTKGDLHETEQLIFYNGILMAGGLFSKTHTATTITGNDQPIQSFVLQSLSGSTQLTIQNLFDLCLQVQVQFPEAKIPSILNEISEVLLTNGGFTRVSNPGIYLLTGVDLSGLRFTPKSRLKKIL